MSKYLKVLKRIDKEMTAKGYVLTGAGDGEEWIYSKNHTKTELYEWATQCDLGQLSYKDANNNGITYYLIYGNAIFETIHDMGYNTDQAGKDADEVSEKIWQHFERLHNEYA